MAHDARAGGSALSDICCLACCFKSPPLSKSSQIQGLWHVAAQSRNPRGGSDHSVVIHYSGSPPSLKAISMRFPFPLPRHNRTPHIQIDLSQCQACGRCEKACPAGVLGIFNILGHTHVHVDRPKKCLGCFKCIKACDNKAIRPRHTRAAAGRCTSPVVEPLDRAAACKS